MELQHVQGWRRDVFSVQGFSLARKVSSLASDAQESE